MINLYPTQVEASDKDGNVIFILKTFDESACEIEFKGIISNSNLSDIFDAIKKGVALLELEG